MSVLAWMKAFILETLLSIYVYIYMKWTHIHNKGHCMCTLASRKVFISEAFLSIYVDIYVHTHMRIENLVCLCLPRKKNQRHFPLSICEHIYTYIQGYCMSVLAQKKVSISETLRSIKVWMYIYIEGHCMSVLPRRKYACQTTSLCIRIHIENMRTYSNCGSLHAHACLHESIHCRSPSLCVCIHINGIYICALNVAARLCLHRRRHEYVLHYVAICLHMYVMQCVAVCLHEHVLQCVATCFHEHVLRCVAVCLHEHILQCVATSLHEFVSQCVAVCCSVLQCVVVCCSVLTWACVAVCCNVLAWICVTVCCNVLTPASSHPLLTQMYESCHTYE